MQRQRPFWRHQRLDGHVGVPRRWHDARDAHTETDANLIEQTKPFSKKTFNYYRNSYFYSQLFWRILIGETLIISLFISILLISLEKKCQNWPYPIDSEFRETN